MDLGWGGNMAKRTAHLALYDGLAEMEVGHLLAELHTGRFTGTSFDLVTVADSPDPVISMGGIRMLPDALLADLEPANSDLLVMPGAEMWDAGGGEPFAAAAGRFLDAGVPVAATCGATADLARAGLLDTRNHTSASAEYLAMTGYAGSERYREERVVVDGDLITAGPQSPVQFARAALKRLGLADERTLDAYELTGNAWEVARVIEPYVARVVVVGPTNTGIRRARTKTDRLDPRKLAKLLAAGSLDGL
jgi:putative intracellular protease/amidase